jgi:hypothetical protein
MVLEIIPSLSPGEVLLMRADLALWLCDGKASLMERAAKSIKGGKGGAAAPADGVTYLPGGGKRVRIRTMAGLKDFLKSQGPANVVPAKNAAEALTPGFEE